MPLFSLNKLAKSKCIFVSFLRPNINISKFYRPVDFGVFLRYRDVVSLHQSTTTRNQYVQVDPQVSPWVVYSYFHLHYPSVFIKEGAVDFSFGVSRKLYLPVVLDIFPGIER